MPIYEYNCKRCGDKFETLRGMRDQGPAPCPTCHSEETMRVLSLFAAQTKGDGFGPAAACDTSAAFGAACCGGG